MLILTLRKSSWRILKFLISSTPMLVGYALCGVALFSPYSIFVSSNQLCPNLNIFQFLDLDTTIVTLFALLNGDVVHSGFNNLAQDPHTFFLSRAYMYTFVVLFITAVRNVFIFIIQDGYHLAKVVCMHFFGFFFFFCYLWPCGLFGLMGIIRSRIPNN